MSGKIIVNKICKAPVVTAVDNLPSVKVMEWTSNSNGLTLALTARRGMSSRMVLGPMLIAFSSFRRRRSLQGSAKPDFPCLVRLSGATLPLFFGEARLPLGPVKCREVTVKKKRVETFRYPVGRTITSWGEPERGRADIGTQAGMHNTWMCGQMRLLATCLALSRVPIVKKKRV